MDDFACAMFPLVLFVSYSYYLISSLPLQHLYGEDYQVVRDVDAYSHLRVFVCVLHRRRTTWGIATLSLQNRLLCMLPVAAFCI